MTDIKTISDALLKAADMGAYPGGPMLREAAVLLQAHADLKAAVERAVARITSECRLIRANGYGGIAHEIEYLISPLAPAAPAGECKTLAEYHEAARHAKPGQVIPVSNEVMAQLTQPTHPMFAPVDEPTASMVGMTEPEYSCPTCGEQTDALGAMGNHCMADQPAAPVEAAQGGGCRYHGGDIDKCVVHGGDYAGVLEPCTTPPAPVVEREEAARLVAEHAAKMQRAPGLEPMAHALDLAARALRQPLLAGVPTTGVLPYVFKATITPDAVETTIEMACDALAELGDGYADVVTLGMITGDYRRLYEAEQERQAAFADAASKAQEQKP